MPEKLIIKVSISFFLYMIDLTNTNVIPFVTAYHVSNPHVAKWEWS